MEKSLLREFGVMAMMVTGIFSVRWSLADQYVVPSGSMLPTIQIGDHVFVDKAAYDFKIPFTHFRVTATGEPARGDIIVFRDPRDPSTHLIKRLVGLPGDQIRVKNGVVTVNGQPCPQDSETEELTGRTHRVQRIAQYAQHEDQTFSVPADHYFFLGDNRDNSADSRVWGYATREALEGRALRVLYNFQQLSRTGEALL